MTDNRTGEQGSIPERQDRIFQKADYWYYKTREGVDIGPFDTRTDAESGANEFISFIATADSTMIETLAQYGKRAA